MPTLPDAGLHNVIAARGVLYTEDVLLDRRKKGAW